MPLCGTDYKDWDGASILSESFNINGLNQVLSAAIGNITYDARGNTVAAGSKTYGYDIFNQLTSAVGSGVNASMDYDPVGRLSEVTGSGVTTKFVYSGSQMIAETNSSGTTLRRYVHGPGVDEPIVWYEGSGTTDRRWLMSDNQGSITAITDDTGAVTSKNRYNEYGVPDLNNTGRFQYTGQVWLAEADIYHYKARAYDPYLGRFLQTDPIGYAAGMNMYAYVGGDPVNRIDPTGLKDEVIVTGTRWVCQGTCITDPFDIRRFMRENSTMLGDLRGALESMLTGIDKAACSHSVSKFVDYLREEIGTRPANNAFVVLSGLGELSKAITGFRHTRTVTRSSGGRLGLWSTTTTENNRYANYISGRGTGHLTNVRFPGSPGGYHLTTEAGARGYFAHYDAYNGTESIGKLIGHGAETGTIPFTGRMPGSRPRRASQTFEQYCNAL